MVLYLLLGGMGMDLNKIMAIEEKIELGFIGLARLEAEDMSNSLEYKDLFKVVEDLIVEEKNLLSGLYPESILELRNKVLKYCKGKGASLALGHLTNSSYLRLLNSLNFLSSSINYEYATYLRSDLNQIIFSFLEYLIHNEAYEEIKRDLVFYKYNLIFMNSFSDEDFFKNKDIETISIESKNYESLDEIGLEFVDKTVFILESKECIDTILEFGEDFKTNSNHYALVVISILEFLARLVLSGEDMLEFLQQDYEFLLSDESVSMDVKNLVNDMLLILEELKSHIDIAR